MEQTKFFIFFVIWVALGISSGFFYIFNKDVKLKRKLQPWLIVGTGVLFIAFVIWIAGIRVEVLLLVIPAVVLISALNLKLTQFCDSCGRTLYPNLLNWKIEFCPKCGAKLEKR
ncbi:MAG: hypothetical protein AB1629_02150 [Candidatus Omnitrophota bacterium]